MKRKQQLISFFTITSLLLTGCFGPSEKEIAAEKEFLQNYLVIINDLKTVMISIDKFSKKNPSSGTVNSIVPQINNYNSQISSLENRLDKLNAPNENCKKLKKELSSTLIGIKINTLDTLKQGLLDNNAGTRLGYKLNDGGQALRKQAEKALSLYQEDMKKIDTTLDNLFNNFEGLTPENTAIVK